MISRFFIDRPVFATVLSIVIMLAGLAAMNALPVAQYPNIIPPQVSVTTAYPGASAETIANTVAGPLEQQINGVAGMIYMNSASSSSGQYTLTVTFAIGTDPDQAVSEVNNRVQTTLAALPDPVQRQGIAVNKQSSSILEVITLFSSDGRYDPVFINNYGLINIIADLQRIPGVGAANFFASINYSMRIWLDPEKLLQYKLTPQDISNAVKEQNAQFSPGKFGQEPMKEIKPFTYTAVTTGRFSNPKEFENIILQAQPDGSTLRLKDVARVELGAQNYNVAANYNGNPSVAIGIYLAPDANALETAQAVAKKMEELSKSFPAGIEYAIPFDTTQFVKISIDEVIKTFFEAVFLVGVVVYLFLQNVRTTFIPLIAVPVALIGTFAGIYILGFSVNLLTLFAMVLAIGIVVDDAIVVLENFERILRTEDTLSPREAALKAMGEVTGPVIAVVLVLNAVFIPVGFMGGLTGEMYKQFAVTIAISVALSGFVALTLTPTLCVLFLKRSHEKPLFFLVLFNRFFERVTAVFMTGVRFILSRTLVALLAFLGVLALTVFLLIKIPTSLVPAEDQGYVFVLPVLLPAASLQRTKDVNHEIFKKIKADPAVKDIITVAGYDFLANVPNTNTSISFVVLKDWSQRKKVEENALFLTKKFMAMFSTVQDAIVLAFNPPAITGISQTGGFEMYLQSRQGDSPQQIQAQAEKFLEAVRRRPELAGVRTTIQAYIPQQFIALDRDKAKALNVSMNNIFDTMQATTGSYFINNFTYWGRTFEVTLQSDAPFREKPENLRNIFVRSADGAMISLDTLVRSQRILGADLVQCFNIFPSAKFLGGAAPGYSSGQSLAAMKEVAKEVLPQDYTIGWTGPAYQEEEASGKGGQAFVFGIIMVFLILAAQYERWSLPIAVITAVPFSVCGALIAIWLRGLENDIYFQIGIVTLVGLSAKNAILMIEFASQLHHSGKSILDAALEAAHLRFRPIVMTSLAFILGCVPLAISTGAGSAARHSIGTGVIGGMVASTLISTLFVPLFFKLVMQLSTRREESSVVVQQSVSHE